VAMNGFRNKIRSFFFGKGKEDKPVIMTEFGPVTEAARLQAALNMRRNPEVLRRVVDHLAAEKGSLAAGLLEAQRRYPEAFSTEEGEDS